ncbi:DNA repair protein RadC [Sphingomonas naasensis]|nr:JAB domain-containing protein [Sphingomonas naasensis]NIJ21120.1 DNA repair protein RadC [Sphingomonas naasensis]
MATRLIDYFGSLRGVLRAPATALIRASGGDYTVVALLGAVARAMIWSLRQELDAQPVLSCSTALVDYLRVSAGFDRYEQLRLLLVDAKLRLIRDEQLCCGKTDMTYVIVADVIRRALEAGATSMILVHNHPSGDPTPSQADRDMTRRIHVAAHAVELHLADHVIVSPTSYFSFRTHQLL